MSFAAKTLIATALASIPAVAACSTVSPEPTVEVEGSSVRFGSVSEMADASQSILVGRVIDVSDGRFIPAEVVTDDYAGTQWLEVSVEVDQVLKGPLEVGDQIAIRWLGHDVRADGTRGPQMVIDGVLPPESGERSLWFLVGESSGKISWGQALTAIEGRVAVDSRGELDFAIPIQSGAADELDGMTVDEVAALVDE